MSAEDLAERVKTLLGEALLAEQKAENAFAPEGRNVNRRAIHAGCKAAWKAYDDALDEMTSELRRLDASVRAMSEALEALLPEGWGDDDVMGHIPGVRLARAALAKAEGRQP